MPGDALLREIRGQNDILILSVLPFPGAKHLQIYKMGNNG